MVVALGDIEPGEMPPTSAWCPREATQNRICRSCDEVCPADSPLAAACSLSRLRERGGERVFLLCPSCMPSPCPSPASGGGDARAAAAVDVVRLLANTGVQTVMSGRCVPPL